MLSLENMTIEQIKKSWNNSTAAILSGDITAADIEARAAIYQYIEKKSKNSAYALTVLNDPELAFTRIFRHYLFTDGDAKHATIDTAGHVAESCRRWSDTAAYIEISEAEYNSIIEAEAAEEARKEAEKKDALFCSVQTYNAEMIAFLDAVKPIFKSFSGKVFNKKLDDALTAAFPYKDSKYKINCYISRRSYHPGEQYSNLYLEMYHRDFNTDDFREYLKIELIETDGKQPRINFEATAENINKLQQKIKSRIAANDDAKKNFQKEVKAAEAVKKAMEAYKEISSNIPTQFKRIYKLPDDIIRACGDYNAISTRNRR